MQFSCKYTFSIRNLEICVNRIVKKNRKYKKMRLPKNQQPYTVPTTEVYYSSVPNLVIMLRLTYLNDISAEKAAYSEKDDFLR